MEIPGTRIVLREYSPDPDDADFYQWWNLLEWQYYDEPDQPVAGVSCEAYERRLEERRRHPAEPDPSTQAWQIDTVAGRHIGFVSTYDLDERARRASVGIGLPEEETWGQGYGTEAMELLLGHLFGELALEEVQTVTWTGNVRMKRVAVKCGSKEVGRSRYDTEFSVRGEPLERIEFSISRGEWLAHGGGG